MFGQELTDTDRGGGGHSPQSVGFDVLMDLRALAVTKRHVCGGVSVVQRPWRRSVLRGRNVGNQAVFRVRRRYCVDTFAWWTVVCRGLLDTIGLEWMSMSHGGGPDEVE